MDTQQSSPLNPKFDKPIYRDLRKVLSPQKTAEMFLDKFVYSERLGKRSLLQEDIVIVFDGSESMGSDVFEKQKRAMLEEMKHGDKDKKTSCRYAVVTISSSPIVNFNFLPSAKAAIKINTISYPAGSTNTHAALEKAAKLFRTGSYRTFSEKKIVLFTDGQSDDKQKTLDSAKKIKNRAVKIFVVRVGKYGDGLHEIAKVASYPPEQFVFRIDKNHIVQ